MSEESLPLGTPSKPTEEPKPVEAPKPETPKPEEARPPEAPAPVSPKRTRKPMSEETKQKIREIRLRYFAEKKKMSEPKQPNVEAPKPPAESIAQPKQPSEARRRKIEEVLKKSKTKVKKETEKIEEPKKATDFLGKYQNLILLGGVVIAALFFLRPKLGALSAPTTQQEAAPSKNMIDGREVIPYSQL